MCVCGKRGAKYQEVKKGKKKKNHKRICIKFALVRFHYDENNTHGFK